MPVNSTTVQEILFRGPSANDLLIGETLLTQQWGPSMVVKIESSRADIIDKIVSYAKTKQNKAQTKLITPFIEQYFSNIAVADLCERSVRDLYGAVLSHWDLLAERQPGECKIRVFNPHMEQHGWQSTHTIIEVINDDMPFLVDSIRMEMDRQGLTTHLMISMGRLVVQRDNKGRITEVLGPTCRETDVIREAPIYMEIDRQTDPKTLENIEENLRRVFNDVRLAVKDWQAMRQEMLNAINEINSSDMGMPEAEGAEAAEFLNWVADDHFTFIGYRDYTMVKENGEQAFRIIPGSGLGVLRDDSGSKVSRYFSDMPPEARKLALSKHILIISKTNTRSTVHRPTYTDYIGVKRFNEKGEITGSRRFIGLYTSDAYNSNLEDIPVLRQKAQTVLKKSGLPGCGHAAKALMNILETLPRDDVFQGSVDELYELGMGILHLQNRRHIKLFVRRDAYLRFMSCLVYLPRENFNTDLIQRMQDILQRTFNGVEASFTTYFPESVLARIHYVIRLDPSKRLQYDLDALEQQLIEVGRSWRDDLCEAMLEHFGEEKGNELIGRYLRAFPAGYREIFTARSAVLDAEHIEKLQLGRPLEMSFYRPPGAEAGTIRFKLFRAIHTVPLSDALPMLENMGLRVIGEQPYELIFRDGKSVWINDFSMEYPKGESLNVEETKELFQDAFYHIWYGCAENDGFNHLVLTAKLSWREITILRAYAKYLRQIGFTFSQQYIEQSLASNPQVARLLVELFRLRFDPKCGCKESDLHHLEMQLQKELDSVANLDEDRILRRYLDVIYATLRTNYYQLDSHDCDKTYISLKFDSRNIPDMPLPKPMFEVFVYSPRFEGVHLRSAKVARGGIRWSDRREDFRTEVLGLVKAQQVKNAVIVPSGAKGGFVPKLLPAEGTREQILEEAIDCYKNFIRGLLDITDNMVAGEVVPPKDTVRYDDDDPYLVG